MLQDVVRMSSSVRVDTVSRTCTCVTESTTAETTWMKGIVATDRGYFVQTLLSGDTGTQTRIPLVKYLPCQIPKPTLLASVKMVFASR